MNSKKRFYHSFTFQVFMQCVASAAISWLIILALIIFYQETRNPLAVGILKGLRVVISTIGDVNSLILIFLILFFSILALMLRRYSKLFRKISSGISEIAEGNFDNVVEVNGQGEISEIAKNLNRASRKLKGAVESGEFAKSSKDRLVINVAHDLRTPLTSISGYLDLIVKRSDLTSEQVQHYAGIAYNKAARMERLIYDLFDYTRYNYDDTALVKTKIDIAYLLKQVADEFYPIFEENELEGRLSIDVDPAYVEADGDLIARVFENIVSNGTRYGKDGKYIDISLEEEDKYYIVKVINYDSIIPKEEFEHIFEGFYKVDKARTTSKGGAGLGLAIAKNIIEMHGGNISVESNFERTVFEIRLFKLAE